jgi:hypothetical protein
MADLHRVDTVRADGCHNAFTDLLRWQDHYYLTFRTAESHGIHPPGDALVLRSSDLERWETCARIRTGGDDRDPKLIDAGDRLGIVFGTWYPRWSDGSLPNTPFDLVSHITVSRDGECWSAPRQVYGVNYWLWRVLPAEGAYYCAAYHFPRREDRLMRSVHLLQSEDLFDWRLVSFMREGGGTGEPVLYQPAPGVLHCVARALEPDNHSWLGKSRAPYTEWEWIDLGVMIHAPVVLKVGDEWICAGRSQPRDLPPGTCAPDSGAHLSVWALRSDRAEHLLTVPSAGDCSYAGLAFDPDGRVAMSYYSQHARLPLPKGPPTPVDVFLARFTL